MFSLLTIRRAAGSRPRIALGVIIGIGLCGSVVRAAVVHKPALPAMRRHAPHPLTGKPHTAPLLAHPQTSSRPLPLLPNPPVTLPYVIPSLPVVRPFLIRPLPQTYGGGGGTAALPSGGSFGSPPLAGGSFGGGHPMGGSFGNGRVH